jgi:hypothetical protein
MSDALVARGSPDTAVAALFLWPHRRGPTLLRRWQGVGVVGANALILQVTDIGADVSEKFRKFFLSFCRDWDK